MKSYITTVLFLGMLCSVSAMTTADFYLSLDEKIERKKPVASTKRTKKAAETKPSIRVKKDPDYRVNLKLWNNKTKKIIAKGKRKLIVDIKTQRAKLYVGKTLVMNFPVTTGKSGKSTPRGTFFVSEKVIDKESNLYGRRDKEGNWIGAKMPYWMRIYRGIGIHQGTLHDTPASNGCVRVPAVVAEVLFSNMDMGTMVSVR